MSDGQQDRWLPWLPVAMIVPQLVVALLSRRVPVVSRIPARPDALWRLTSFGDPRITEVGALLDTKLAALLRLMSLPLPPELEEDR